MLISLPPSCSSSSFNGRPISVERSGSPSRIFRGLAKLLTLGLAVLYALPPKRASLSTALSQHLSIGNSAPCDRTSALPSFQTGTGEAPRRGLVRVPRPNRRLGRRSHSTDLTLCPALPSRFHLLFLAPNSFFQFSKVAGGGMSYFGTLEGAGFGTIAQRHERRASERASRRRVGTRQRS